MKWKIARIVIIICLAFPFQAIGRPPLPAAAAGPTVDITVHATPGLGAAFAPTNFTVTMVSDNLVTVNWTKGINAVNTTIRVKYDSPPISKDDGYLLYTGNGTSANDTFLNLDVMWSKQYYLAASQNVTGGWSASYVYDYVENPKVTEIANALNNLPTSFAMDLSGLGSFVTLFLLIAIVALAFWQGDKPNRFFLDALAGPAAIAYGLAMAIPSASLQTWIVGFVTAGVGAYLVGRLVLKAWGNWSSK